MARSTPLQRTKSGKLVSKKSKSGDPRCSAAASAWARGQATSETYKLLGECRSKARMQGQAKLQREAGNEGKAQVLEKRAERGLTGKDRIAKAKELIAQRKAKIDTQVAAKATTAKPSLREQADAARAKKGGLKERAKAFADRNTDFGKTGTSAGRKEVSVKLFEPKGPRFNDRSAARGAIQIQETGKGSKQFAVTRREYGGSMRSAKTVTVTNSINEAKGYVKSEVAALFERRYQRLQQSLAPKSVPFTPSPRDQAATARTAKGDRSTRLKALSDKAMAIAERRATKANSLIGAAQDRMLDRSMASAQRYNRLEAARTPFTPASKATPAKAPGRGTPERLARVEAAKNALFGKRLDREFTKLDAPKGRNFQGLDKVRAALPYKADEFVARLREQRKAGRYSLDSYEGAAGSLPERLKAASIMEGGRPMTFLSRRDAQPYTPRAKMVAMSKPTVNKPDKGTRGDRLYALAERSSARLNALPKTADDKRAVILARAKRIGDTIARVPLEKPERQALAAQIRAARQAVRNAPAINAVSDKQASFASSVRSGELSAFQQEQVNLRQNYRFKKIDKATYRKLRTAKVLEQGAVASLDDARQILDNRGGLRSIAKKRV